MSQPGPFRRLASGRMLSLKTHLWYSILCLGFLSSFAEASEFRRVTQFPEGKQSDAFTSAFLSGLSLSNSVERTYQTPLKTVWIAAKRGAEELEKVGKRELVSANERTSRIQNGKISQDASLGAGTGDWSDEIITELTAVSDVETKVVVSRRVVQTVLKKTKIGFDRQWRSAKSNGEIESWLHTRIEVEIAALASRPPEPDASAPKMEQTTEGGIEGQLTKLRELKDKNLISEEEYQSMRKRVLEGVLKQ